MVYATNIGLLSTNPLANTTSAFEPPTEQNGPTIMPNELPKFMQALSLARVELQRRCVIKGNY